MLVHQRVALVRQLDCYCLDLFLLPLNGLSVETAGPCQQPETFAKLLMTFGVSKRARRSQEKQYDVKSVSWMLNKYIIYTHILNILYIYISYIYILILILSIN